MGVAVAGDGTLNYSALKTKHVIWIINGNGSRKKDWYENPELSPNYARLAREGFVYEESHNDSVSQHGRSWRELMTGNPDSSRHYPTPLHYLRKAYGDAPTKYWFIAGSSEYRQWHFDPKWFRMKLSGYSEHTDPIVIDMSPFAASLPDLGLKYPPIPRQPFIGDALAFASVPYVMKRLKPRILIVHQSGHDVAHDTGYAEYEKVCRTTDEQIGRILDFIKNDRYFSSTTAIVIRPECGRDDDINCHGHINHSEGYYQTHRSAEIWWGPDIRAGVHRGVVNRVDFVPSLTKLFGVDSEYAVGRPHMQMFKKNVRAWCSGIAKLDKRRL